MKLGVLLACVAIYSPLLMADNIIRTSAPIYKLTPPLVDNPVVPEPDNDSCLSILKNKPGSVSGMYTLSVADRDIQAYCDMISNGGGWTLVGRGRQKDIAGWSTTRAAINMGAMQSPTGSTFKLSDIDINNIPKTAYKVVTSGYNNTRYFKGSCVYNNLVASSGDCAISYATEAWTLPRGNGQAGAAAGGLSDHRSSVTGDGYYILTSTILNTAAGWAAGNGSKSNFTGNGNAGTLISQNIYVR